MSKEGRETRSDQVQGEGRGGMSFDDRKERVARIGDEVVEMDLGIGIERMRLKVVGDHSCQR